ncbi:hypothetical protein [Bradyrhizobium sp. S3.12.5]|uniref:hypothetical protein n=1 Tax=Bradyrhizobium sp. S3.12.5 TaxID=3156386 RepID=UPI00339224B9
MPKALVVALTRYLTVFREALDQSTMQVIVAEFDCAVSLAIEHQPDLILIAPPPIPDVLLICKRLLENGSTKHIPIFLISVDYNTIDGGPRLPRTAASQARDGDDVDSLKPPRQRSVGQEEGRYVARTQRQKQILSILDLLHYAQGEISEMGIETSAALLEATIVDVAQSVGIPES